MRSRRRRRTSAAGKCDAVVYFPPDFAERLAEFRRHGRRDEVDREAGERAASREIF